MQKSLPVSRAGRPKDPAKRVAIVEAATSLFAEQRYDMVTMEDVAAKAGVSKMTVYSHFADKEALLEDVVRGVSDRMTRGLSYVGSEKLPLRERLTDIGTAFLTVMINVHVTGIAHSLPMSSGDQALRHRFYNAGTGRTVAALASILKEAAERDELLLDSPAEAAQDLVSLWEGGLPARIVFGVVEPAAEEEIAQQALRGTNVFLRAYGNPRKRKQLSMP
ncbi:bacterial regulatory s, lacI family protein [Burkholderia gladioli]|uniref:Bacterial regulatory s, lacI family protein n=1 Tax=Burkholderia gladioli TaxID=28095 RepID=A0A095F210_BURGA|nr:TetR/AcrR family transcriptional regulator [Burkholderia gladioli]AJW99564.1 bacterial regulatory s, lacI family protein [Burkholderia gladioli]ASD79910.1 TetR family transcriptional regulator [Burkholderia gladioli pv. gladioli]AWY54848.1 TetR family transcriptional regulator [Burkholderia gladioli pv. gladioli]KGC11388.1 bacterial regulatory s, lacI family protein [Burkholderia gladioli]PEH37861.1 TetR/AcrR family transcriptional regulator [Burkholderia gladioli]